MRRSVVIGLAVALAFAALPGSPAGAGDAPAPVWSSPLALGPTDVTGISAREGLVVAGGKLHEKSAFGGGTEVVASAPRVAGIFRSTDQARSWSLGEERVVNEDGSVSTRPITTTPSVVFLPPTAPDAYAVFGSDVWRSEDDARTWARVGTTAGQPTTLDALADGRLVAGLAGGGLQVSADRGATWSSFGTGLPARRVNEVAPLSATVILVATDGGAYRSADGGATFAQVTTGFVSPGMPVLGIAHEQSPTVYLAMASTATLIYSSTNQGQSWTPLVPIYSQNVLPLVTKGALDLVVQGSVYVLYAGTDRGLFRSGNSSAVGLLWERLDPEPGFRGTGEFAYEDTNPSPTLRQHTVYASVRRASPVVATSTEVRLAAPGWIDELEGGRICGGLVARKDGALFAACGRHVFRSNDGGATWSGAGRGLPYISVGIGDTPYFPLSAGPDGSLWTSGFHYGLYHSNAQVTSWSKAPVPAASTGIVEPHPANPMVVFAAGLLTNGNTEVLWRTKDGGSTWERIDEVGDTIYTVDTSPKAPNRVLVGTFDGGAWLSEDGGDTWTKAVGLPEGSDHIYRASFSDADPMRGWALGNGADSDFAIFRSDDGGKNWSEVGPVTVEGKPKSTFEITPSPWDADTIYATAIDGDIIVSRDGALTFSLLDSGLPKVSCSVCDDVSHLAFDASTRGVMYITAGVLGSGVDPQSAWVYRGVDPGV